jgi:hypothetical protein
MADLERALRELAAAEEWPPTPDIAGAVAARLREAPVPAPAARRPTWASRRRRALAVALAVLVAVPSAAVAFPEARDDLLEWLGLKSVEVRRTPQPPPGRELLPEPDLGRVVPLERAGARIGFEPLVPAALGAPDEARVQGRRLSLVYRPSAGRPATQAEGVGVLLTEQRGHGVIAEKAVGPGTAVRRVDVDGARGAWIEGAPHSIIFQGPRGAFREDVPRLAGDTLVWERDGLVLRIEGARGLEDALAITRSLR